MFAKKLIDVIYQFILLILIKVAIYLIAPVCVISIFVENEKSRVINTLLRHTYDILLKQDCFKPPA